MSEIEEFDRIATDIKQILTNQPSHPNALELYGLYKQATKGDITISRPSLFDFRGKAKYDAWHSRKGLSKDEAKLQYIALGKTVLNEIMSQSLDLFQMTQTVKSVLPQVPIDVIRRDLIITSNVDETITRLLDGTVYYDGETEVFPPVKADVDSEDKNGEENNHEVISQLSNYESANDAESFASSIKNSTIKPENLKTIPPMSYSTKAAAFEKDPQQRMKSYQERKKQLLEIARAHYIEKYGLNHK